MEVEAVPRDKLFEELDNKINALPEDIRSTNCSMQKPTARSEL
jgi:hypothetical protein